LAVPGGGDVTDKQFTDFYSSSGKRLAALLSFFVLVIGCWLLVWLFAELRATLLPGVRADLGQWFGVAGAVMVIIGGGIFLGPAGVQINSKGSAFVGPVLAHALAQAGLIPMVVGFWTMGVGIFLTSHRMRGSAAFPGWLGTFGMIIAVLLLAAYIAIPALLVAIWAIVVGITSRPVATALTDR
jgi:hypothetical protein